MEIIGKKEAKARGLNRFYTGKPCIRGHVSERRVSTGTCNECNLENCKTWRMRHRNKYDLSRKQRNENGGVRQAKLKVGPCCDCGGTFPSECMDFDHVRGEKVRNVALMRTCSNVTFLAEVAKCDLVCANCHRIRTKKRGQYRRAVA